MRHSFMAAQAFTTAASNTTDPRKLWSSGISDHAPVIATISPKRSLRPAERPISSLVANSLDFRKAHDELVVDANLDGMDTVSRWKLHKQIIRQAGAEARNAILVRNSSDPRARNLIYGTIARAVARQDVAPARTVSSRVKDAALLISVIGNVVALVNPTDFNRKFCANKINMAGVMKNERMRTLPERDPFSKAILSLERTFAPFCKKTVCDGVTEQGRVFVVLISLIPLPRFGARCFRILR